MGTICPRPDFPGGKLLQNQLPIYMLWWSFLACLRQGVSKTENRNVTNYDSLTLELPLGDTVVKVTRDLFAVSTYHSKAVHGWPVMFTCLRLPTISLAISACRS
jgi:hypothetical protein